MRRARWFVAAVVALLVAIAAAPARAGTAQPDGEVKRKNGSYVGLGVVNNSGAGQTATVTRRQGKTAVFKFRYTNVGFATDDLDVVSCGVEPELRVRYFLGDEDVTEELTGSGFTFFVGPGETTEAVRAEVKVRHGAPDEFVAKTCGSASAFNPIDRDEPAWKVKVV